MMWKYVEQNILFPKGLNWVQHWVSQFGLFIKKENKNGEDFIVTSPTPASVSLEGQVT